MAERGRRKLRFVTIRHSFIQFNGGGDDDDDGQDYFIHASRNMLQISFFLSRIIIFQLGKNTITMW